ncbi:MAG: DUF3137 domain-containing protein [Eubacterium sp.]|nr:DUF3137 domain-containing protein [Eubacterium sp.]
MENKRFVKGLEKNIGIKAIKNQINAINMLFVFLVAGGAFAIYLNHTGIWLSYGIIIAAISMIILALFLSYRIKQQVKLDGLRLDYRNLIVKPYAEAYFIGGSFSKTGSLTEREIVSTNMFSDTGVYKYSSCNELKGEHKGILFSNSDVFEDCEINNIHLRGRFYEFTYKDSRCVNPVVFTSASAPILDCQNSRVHIINTKNEIINRMFRVYAFDEDEANDFLTDNMIYKLRQIASLQLGKILRICFYDNKVYIYYTTEKATFEEVLTKKHNVAVELDKLKEKFMAIGMLIDIL